MKIITCYDNGGETFDRYTIIIEDTDHPDEDYALAASDDPYHPQGFGQHTTAEHGPHLGGRVLLTSLPKKVLQFVMADLGNQEEDND